MQYCRLYRSNEKYVSDAPKLKYPTVSYITETSDVQYTTYFPREVLFISAGTVVLTNGISYKFLSVDTYNQHKDENLLVEDYTPIGIVIIPQSHSQNNDEITMMSLNLMSANDPEKGIKTWDITSTSPLENLSIAPISTSISTKFTKTASIGQTTAKDIPQFNEIQQATYVSTGLIPNNIIVPQDMINYTGMDTSNRAYVYGRNQYDTNTYYSYRESGRSFNLCPSPYMTNGNKNLIYFEVGSSNALSDMDGRGNTDKMLRKRGEKDYTIWKPEYKTSADYPAASCCDMYHTLGTNQGDWYLPSLGELGYVAARAREIQNALDATNGFKITNLENTSYNIDTPTLNLFYCWSSTQKNNNQNWFLDFNGGTYYYTNNTAAVPCVAFCKLKIENI